MKNIHENWSLNLWSSFQSYAVMTTIKCRKMGAKLLTTRQFGILCIRSLFKNINNWSIDLLFRSTLYKFPNIDFFKETKEWTLNQGRQGMLIYHSAESSYSEGIYTSALLYWTKVVEGGISPATLTVTVSWCVAAATAVATGSKAQFDWTAVQSTAWPAHTAPVSKLNAFILVLISRVWFSYWTN